MLFIIVFSIFVGIAVTLAIQCLFTRQWFRSLPVIVPAWKPQTESFVLPKELLESLKDETLKKQKESCLSLNLILQFLFQELKDTKRIRRWAMKRMKMEFEEMLRSNTGKFLEHITVRDFNLGRTFPVIQNVTVDNVSVNDDNTLEEVSALLSLTYNGRFQIAVDVDMVFGKSAYLSVILTKLQGTARLQFTRQPYTHWSFAFTEDPLLQLEVESHFEGRPIAQLTSLITNQIRKSVRKKHTLPSYKIRYRPFFVMPVTELAPQSVYYHGNKISIGRLEVVVIGCTRLANVPSDSHIYCSLALDSIQWLELMSFRHKLWMAHNVEVIRTAGQSIGLSFGEIFLVDKYEEMVFVTEVATGTPAAKADIQKNDLLVSVNGVKVTNSRQAARLMKNAAEKIVLRVERAIKGFSASNQKPPSSLRNEDDTVSLKSLKLTTGISETTTETTSSSAVNQNGDLEATETNVSTLSLSTESEKSFADETSSVKSFDGKGETQSNQFSSSSTGIPSSLNTAPSSSPPTTKKGFTQILSTGSGLFRGRKPRSDGVPLSSDLAKLSKDGAEKCTDVRQQTRPEGNMSDGQGVTKKKKVPTATLR